MLNEGRQHSGGSVVEVLVPVAAIGRMKSPTGSAFQPAAFSQEKNGPLVNSAKQIHRLWV